MTLRDDIIREGRARLGIPYGLPPGPGETDCSLYVRDVFEAAGLPFSPGVRVAEQERQDTVPIDWADVLPGDLLFFEGTYDAGAPGADGHIASHVGISLGAGTHKMLNALEPVSAETRIDTPYWQEHIFEARRHPALMSVAAPSALPRGIDVSSNNGSVNWLRVAAAGISFAWIKITEDDGYLNPRFESDWALSKRVGLLRGAYHFARPEGTDAVQEADFFLDQINAHGGLAEGDLLALDLESGDGDLGQWALDFLHRCEERAGFKPFVYTAEWFSEPHELNLQPALAEYPLWQASYRAEMPAPIEPWSSITIWQNSSSGRLDGLSGDVDLNVSTVSRDQLRALGKGGAMPSPAEYSVGPGILAEMTAHGDVPATDEIYVKNGGQDVYSEAYGTSGSRYIYLPSMNKVWRYDPAA